jgi:hypothetical protein
VRPFAWTKPPLQHLIRCAGFTYQSDPLDRPGMARPGGLLAMSAFPERVVGCRVSLHIVLLEACSAFTRACTLARPPFRDPLYRRLQPFRHLHDCSGCFRRERIAGWAFHPLESAALSRRIPEADIRTEFLQQVRHLRS